MNKSMFMKAIQRMMLIAVHVWLEYVGCNDECIGFG
jgi:hypothetical protein